MIVVKISLSDFILLNPAKSTLQFGIGIFGKGLSENVDGFESEYADIKAGIKTSCEFRPYSPAEFKLLSLERITSLFSANFKNVDEFFVLSSFTNAVFIAKKEIVKLPPLVGVRET